MNTTLFSGNTGTDVRFSFNKKGTLVGRFPLAAKSLFRGPDGPKEGVTWVDVVAYGSLANTLHRVGKGSYVVVSGELRSFPVTDPVSGFKYRVTYVHASSVEFGHLHPATDVPAEDGTPSGPVGDAAELSDNGDDGSDPETALGASGPESTDALEVIGLAS